MLYRIYSKYTVYQGTITLTQADLPRFAPGQKLPDVQLGQVGQQRVMVQHRNQRLGHPTHNMATFDFKDSDPDARIKTSITKKSFSHDTKNATAQLKQTTSTTIST